MRRIGPGVGLAAVLALAACNSHEPVPAFRQGVLIFDRGISIPLPPPSLIEQPTQEVDVDGEFVGQDTIAAGTVVRAVDAVGGAEVEVEVESGAQGFTVRGLLIDLTDNCLEFSLVAPDGRRGEQAQFTAVIDADDDAAVLVVEGCPET